MCCWGYGELLKELHGREGCGCSSIAGWRWGRSWGCLCLSSTREGIWILSRKGVKSLETALQIPLSVRCLVWSTESPPNTRFFLPSSPKMSQQSCPQGCGVAGGVGAVSWLRREQMGSWLRSGLFSVWDEGGTSLCSVCKKIIWAIAFLPALRAAKLGK